MNDELTPEQIEDAALKSVANMGAPEFDTIKASGEKTLLLKDGLVVMIIDAPFDYITAYIKHNFVKP